MTRRTQIEQIFLWLFVIMLGIGIGAGLYETRVWVPLWSSAPPESVWFWESFRNANPQYAPNAGGRFWIFVTPTLGLLALATLITGWKMRGEHRKWLLFSTITIVIMVASTIIWFVPTISAVLNSRSLGLSPEQVATKTRMWVTLNWVRTVVAMAAWLAALRALTVPPLRE